MYEVLWPVGISCRVTDALWEIETTTGVAEGRLALSGKSDKGSFIRDYGPPIDIAVNLVPRTSDAELKRISNDKGEWFEIGSVRAAMDQGELSLLEFGLSFDRAGFDDCVSMAMTTWKKRTHDLFIIADVFGIEQIGGPGCDRWPPGKPYLPLTSFKLFLRPKTW